MATVQLRNDDPIGRQTFNDTPLLTLMSTETIERHGLKHDESAYLNEGGPLVWCVIWDRSVPVPAAMKGWPRMEA